jgi:hypothetical protein
MDNPEAVANAIMTKVTAQLPSLVNQHLLQEALR